MQVSTHAGGRQARATRGGPLTRRLLRWLFTPVSFPPEATTELGELAARGTVVYVMRSAGILNFLYFNWAFARRGLPVARAALGLPLRYFRPLGRLFASRRELGSSLRSNDAEAVVQTVAEGGAAMVFLRRPSVLRYQGHSLQDDPFPGLVELQRRIERPIFLVPQLLIFKRAPVRVRPGIKDVVLGSADVPGRLHASVSFLFNRKRAMAKVGRPVNLKEAVQGEPDASDAVVARKVRGALGVGLARELRVVVGPPLKDARRLQDEILRDRVLREEMSRIGPGAEAAVRRSLDEIGARYSPAFIDGANTVARWVFHRLYDGVFVDEEGLLRAAEASRRAPLVLCPTHRSHIDYLLVSHVLFERGMTPPLVAAGANLAFWPLGAIFRRGGAFFIRRSFKGDRAYAAALAAYVRKVAREGYTQEFYPEGGRTRTGRILHPKYGLLAMEVDAWAGGARDDLFFVPLAIDYNRLIESGSYARELAGGEKRKEGLGDLLRAPAVLGKRWGQVHLQVDHPISLAQFARDRGFDPATASAEDRKVLVRALAHRIAYGMGQVQTLTAPALVAAALLTHRRRGLTASELQERVELLVSLARVRGRRFSLPVQQALEVSVREAVEVFEGDKQLTVSSAEGQSIYRVEENARTPVSFYKNNIVHHFEEEAVLLGGLFALGGSDVPREVLLRRVAQLSRLLKSELSFRPAPLPATVAETAARLASFGILKQEGEALTIVPSRREHAAFLRDLLADVIESYRLLLQSFSLLESAPLDRKDLVRRCMEHARARYLAGHIERAEAISRPTFDTAIGWCLEEGHLTQREDGKLVPSGRLASPAERQAFIDSVSEFLLV